MGRARALSLRPLVLLVALVLTGLCACQSAGDDASFMRAVVRELGDALETTGAVVDRAYPAIGDGGDAQVVVKISHGDGLADVDPFRVLATAQAVSGEDEVMAIFETHPDDGTLHAISYRLTLDDEVVRYEGRAPRPGSDYDSFHTGTAYGVTPQVLDAIVGKEIPAPVFESSGVVE